MLHRWLKAQLLGGCRSLFSSASRINGALSATVGCRSSAPQLSVALVKSSASHFSAFAPAVSPSTLGSIPGYQRLRVDGLPASATEEKLRDHFSPFGMVLSCYLIRDKNTKESRRHAYVVFAYKEGFDRVLATQPHVFDGHVVRLRLLLKLTLMLEGLSTATTKESLLAYFSRYSSVTGSDIQYKRREGDQVGFVYFSSEEEFNNALSLRQHAVDGKVVNVKPRYPKELSMYVGDLSPNTTSQGLRDYFSAFGTLLHADVKLDSNSGESRRFGLVTFSSQQELNKVVEMQPHVIDGKIVRLDYSTNEFGLFVAGFQPAVGEERLNQYFKQFGPSVCRIARDKSTNRLLHYGFISCSSQQIVDRILDSRPHVIDGKIVDVGLGDKRRGKECTLFVGGLPIDITQDMLYEAFSRFGRILTTHLIVDPATRHFKGCGFVNFDSVEGVRNALAARPHTINGKQVDVKSRCTKEQPIENQGSSYRG